jgi:hypothetical protein
MFANVRGSARTLANIMAVSSVMLPSPISCITAQAGKCERQTRHTGKDLQACAAGENLKNWPDKPKKIQGDID